MQYTTTGCRMVYRIQDIAFAPFAKLLAAICHDSTLLSHYRFWQCSKQRKGFQDSLVLIELLETLIERCQCHQYSESYLVALMDAESSLCLHFRWQLVPVLDAPKLPFRCHCTKGHPTDEMLAFHSKANQVPCQFPSI
jgi:hypothetical protein